MSISKLAAIILAVALIASAAANIYFITQTTESGSATKVDMLNTLSQIQLQVDTELTRIGQSLAYASEQLSTVGLTGAQADAILSELAANSSFIIDAGTQNMDRTMVAIQPPEYSSTIGQDVGEQKWLNTNPNGEITPMMTPVIPLIENMTGIAMAAPVFDSNKEMIGVISVIFNPHELLSSSISEVTRDPQYEFTVLQLDGLIMFDSHSAQGQNFFTSTDNTEILNIGNQIVNDSSGYSTYTIEGGEQKQSYWTTINAYGQDWRLIIHHAI